MDTETSFSSTKHITKAEAFQVSLGHFIRHFIPDFYDTCYDQKVHSIPAFVLFLALLLKLKNT